MRMPALLLTVVAATLLLFPASAQDKGNRLRKEESAKKINELQKERIDALKDLVAIFDVLFQQGRVEHNQLIDARERLFKAELAAAEKQSDRIALYKNMVEAWKRSEELAELRFKAKRKTVAPVLSFKALRLEAQIHLEQAKVKAEQAKAKQPAVEHRKIGVTSPKAKDVVITQQYVCQIHGQRHIKVRSLQKGYLEQVPVKEGQAVKKGDLMFKIVPTLYKAKLDAELAEAKLAELELNYTKTLAEKNAISNNEVVRHQAKVARAQAKLKLAEAEYNFTVLRAPFDGIMGRLHEQEGSLVTEADILTTLSDNSSMWVYFNVPQTNYLEYLAAGVVEDSDAKVELDLGNGRRFKQTGKLAAVDAQFNNANGTIPFRADFPNPDGVLRHGMTGNVLIRRTLKNAIVIPQRAVFELLDKRYVWVVGKDDVAHRRAVVVQNELEGSFVIERGVGVGDRIVYDGVRQVREGQKVEYDFRPPEQILGR